MSKALSGFVRKIVGGSVEDWDHVARVTRLATYNAEVARGLVHAESWRIFMREEQKWWDEEGSKK